MKKRIEIIPQHSPCYFDHWHNSTQLNSMRNSSHILSDFDCCFQPHGSIVQTRFRWAILSRPASWLCELKVQIFPLGRLFPLASNAAWKYFMMWNSWTLESRIRRSAISSFLAFSIGHLLWHRHTADVFATILHQVSLCFSPFLSQMVSIAVIPSDFFCKKAIFLKFWQSTIAILGCFHWMMKRISRNSHQISSHERMEVQNILCFAAAISVVTTATVAVHQDTVVVLLSLIFFFVKNIPSPSLSKHNTPCSLVSALVA